MNYSLLIIANAARARRPFLVCPQDFAATYLSSVEAVSAKSSYLIRYLTLHASLSRSEDFAGPCFSFVLPLSSLPARILLDLAFPI